MKSKQSSHRSGSTLAMITLIFVALALPATTESANFATDSHTLTNPYLPFTLGTRLEYTGYGAQARETYTMEAIAQEKINGINCLKIFTQTSFAGSSFLFLAQDNEGNVWTIRSADTLGFGHCDLNELFMPATPILDQTLTNRNCSIALMSRVKDLGASVTTPLGDFSKCLVLRSDQPGATMTSWYAPGFGLVKQEYSGYVSGGFYLGAIAENSPPQLLVSTNINGPYQAEVGAELDAYGSVFILQRPNKSHFYRVVHDTARYAIHIAVWEELLLILFEEVPPP